MALNDDATLVINTGNYLTAPTGTPLPAQLTSPTTPWENVGHTSLSDIFGIKSDGGDATVVGTLQNKSLRTKYAARTETLSFTLQQFDIAGLRLFYGKNAPLLADGTLGVPTDPEPTVCAFTAIFIDGDHVFAFYAPKAEIYRNDDMSLSDTESLAGLPLGVKPMVYGTNDWTYAVTPLASVVQASVANAGTPGSYGPAGAVTPADLADLSDVTASPTTAWTTGQYVNLGDGSEASWDGSAWETGAAV